MPSAAPEMTTNFNEICPTTTDVVPAVIKSPVNQVNGRLCDTIKGLICLRSQMNGSQIALTKSV